MNDCKNTRLHFIFHGKRYNIRAESRNYSNEVTVSKLTVGKVRLWLILQNKTWRVISDLPMCTELKKVLIRKIAKAFGIPVSEKPETTGQIFPQKPIMLNAVLNN